MIDQDSDLQWLRLQMPHVSEPAPDVSARAREELLLHAIAPAHSGDVKGLNRPRLRRLVPAVGVAAAAAGLALALIPAAPERTAPPAHASAHLNGALMHLADYIAANETSSTGNATLVLRTQSYPDSPTITGADLYTDSGEYFYAETESGLPQQIQENDDQGGGFIAREEAAALEAVNGNVDKGAYDMAVAPNPTMYGQLFGAGGHQVQEDNMTWEDSLDAIVAGAGNSAVRQGILLILSTIPSVTVTNTATDGQPTLTITAKAPDVPANYQEQIVINAQTGVPVGFAGGNIGQAPGVTVTYQVSRVTVAAIEAGHV